MGAVGSGLALSLDTLLQRFPFLLDLAAGRARRPDEDRSPAALAAVIEHQIIPRLLLQHPPLANPPDRAGEAGRSDVEAADIGALAQIALREDAVALAERVDALAAAGVGADALLLDWMAPAARLLGQWWEEDRCSFVDVTMGLWRIQEVTQEIADRLPRRRPVSPVLRRAMFATLPGEQHRLGIQLLGAFFTAGGWQVMLPEGNDSGPLLEEVAATTYHLVGLSLNQDHQVDALPGLIGKLRAASTNPDLVVMVGGALVSERPELAFLVGADATARDAAGALRRAESILAASACADGANGLGAETS